MQDPERIVLMTMEFDSYRRIIIVLPGREQFSPRVQASLWKDASAGEFRITLVPIDPRKFVGKHLRKEGLKYPIRLAVSFPDSLTLEIAGRVNELGQIQGYKTIPDGAFIFDIFAKSPPLESVFREETIPAYAGRHKKQSFVPEARNSSSTLFPDPVDSKGAILGMGNLGRLKRSILYAVLVILTGLAIGSGVVGLQAKLAPARPRSIRQNQETTVTQGEDRESLIRSLMKTENLSYDEAAMKVNIEQSRADEQV